MQEIPKNSQDSSIPANKFSKVTGPRLILKKKKSVAQHTGNKQHKKAIKEAIPFKVLSKYIGWKLDNIAGNVTKDLMNRKACAKHGQEDLKIVNRSTLDKATYRSNTFQKLFWKK